MDDLNDIISSTTINNNLRQQNYTSRPQTTPQNESNIIENDYRKRNCRSVNSTPYKKFVKKNFLN